MRKTQRLLLGVGALVGFGTVGANTGLILKFQEFRVGKAIS